MAYVQHLLGEYRKIGKLTMDKVNSHKDIMDHANSTKEESKLLLGYLKSFIHTNHHDHVERVIAAETVG